MGGRVGGIVPMLGLDIDIGTHMFMYIDIDIGTHADTHMCVDVDIDIHFQSCPFEGF